MTNDNDTFLRITFEGGRFASHSLPVDVLAEFAVLQRLVHEMARSEFLRMHPGRLRVPRGFAEGTRLSVIRTEDNCFSADLRRASIPTLPFVDVNDAATAARDRLLGGLREGGGGLAELDAPVLRILAKLGDRIQADEWIALAPRKGPSPVRIDQEMRARVFSLLDREVEQVLDLDGEVEKVDDSRDEFTLLDRTGRSVVVEFDRPRRGEVAEALKHRPAIRMRVFGLVRMSTPPRMAKPEELDSYDHDRRADIDRLVARIDSFGEIPNGWMNGHGVAPDETVLAHAKDVLSRLLADFPDVMRPAVFPTPTGCVQVEWVVGNVSIELVFEIDGSIVGSAVDAVSGRSKDCTFSADNVTRFDASALGRWIAEVSRALTEDR